MRGVDVGERWHDLSAHVAPRCMITSTAFWTCIMSMRSPGRSGRARWARCSGALCLGIVLPASDARLKAIVPVAARALVAHAQGNYERAAWLLRDVRPDFVRLGGSDVQRHLFELIYRDSCAHGGMQTRRVASA
jgi:hypothetical protein